MRDAFCVRIAPPSVSDDAAVKNSEWAECLVKYSPEDADAQEVWVFRKRDYNEFQRLISEEGWLRQRW